MIFHNPDIIFLHIPKTAGNYFTNLFIDYSEESKIVNDKNVQDGKNRFSIKSKFSSKKHHTLSEYKHNLILKNYEIFFTYRDPLMRLLSGFFSPNYVLAKYNLKDVNEYKFSLLDFKNFIKNEKSSFEYLVNTKNKLKLKFVKTFKIKSFVKNDSYSIKFLDFNNLDIDIKKFISRYNFDIPNKELKSKVNVSFHSEKIQELSNNKNIKEIITNSHHRLDYEILNNFERI